MKPWKKKKQLDFSKPIKIEWWHDTNDPNTWSPYVSHHGSIPKSTAAEMVDAQATWGPLSKEMYDLYKKKLEQKMLYGSGAYAQGSALSASAGSVTNYTQVYPAYWQDALKPQMTYEKAVALNNGD